MSNAYRWPEFLALSSVRITDSLICCSISSCRYVFVVSELGINEIVVFTTLHCETNYLLNILGCMWTVQMRLEPLISMIPDKVREILSHAIGDNKKKNNPAFSVGKSLIFVAEKTCRPPAYEAGE